MTELTIGIPTTQREEAARNALVSVNQRVSVEHDVLIVDSSPSATPDRYDAETICPDSILGPTAESQRLLDECDTRYLLYLHDDIEPRPGAVTALLEQIKASPDEVAIVGGRMIEPDGPVDPGADFVFDDDADPPVVHDERVTVDDREPGIISVDVPKPPVIVDVPMLRDRGVRWDPNIKFKLDQEDFYMSCLNAGLAVIVVNDAIFDHLPYKYSGPSMQEVQDREEDHEYFREKWGYYLAGFEGGKYDG